MPKRLLLSLLMLAAAAPAAPAATVQMRDEVEREGGTTYVYGVVSLTAAAGEVNRVSVDHRPGDRAVVISDPGAALTGDARCANVDAHTVLCDGRALSGITEVLAELGDMDDTATATGDDRLPYLAIRGGDGNDVLAGRWATLDGGDGNDALRGDAGAEVLHGGAGDDLLEGHDGGDYAHGGAGDDIIRGGEGHDVLLGGTTISGVEPAGTDRLEGGPGNDTLDDQDGLGRYAPGADVLVGGGGTDAVHSYVLRRAAVTVDLSRPGGHGEAGENDTIAGIENAAGGSGDDMLLGDDGPNRLDGDRGRDTLRGNGGNDVLVSEVNPRESRQNAMASAYGPDRVSGDAGDDVVETLATLESVIACGEGRDAVRLASASTDGARSSLGPLVSRTCERLRMGRVRIDPFPTAITRDAFVFEVPAADCCRHRIELQTVQRRPTPLDSATLRSSVRLTVGRTAARRGATVRAKITRAGRNRFVWRMRTGPRAF